MQKEPAMGTETLLAILAFGTLGAVVLFAWRSQIKTEERRHERPRKSTSPRMRPTRWPASRSTLNRTPDPAAESRLAEAVELPSRRQAR
jgi:hypothetical protein